MWAIGTKLVLHCEDFHDLLNLAFQLKGRCNFGGVWMAERRQCEFPDASNWSRSLKFH